MEGGLEVICLEIFRHCSGKGERVRAVRDLESTLLYLFLPALNQRENKKKKKNLLSVLFFCLWAATASKIQRKKGGRKERSQREKGRASLVYPRGFLTAPT